MKLHTFFIRIRELIMRLPVFYRTHYTKFFFGFFIGIIIFWGWLFYFYAWKPTASDIEIPVDTFKFPREQLDEVLQDIESRRKTFEGGLADSNVQDLFWVSAVEEGASQE